jgi:uncharacterized protein (DUF2141 family)
MRLGRGRTRAHLASRDRLAIGLVVVSLHSGISAVAQDATGSIAGIVEAADRPGQRLPHAIVSVSHPGTSVQISVVADDAGQFRFDDLRAGAYTVTASKAAYLTSAIGARRPGEPGTPIALAAGQHVGDVRLTLTRGAVIAGFVRDAAGVPATNIPIVVAPAETAMGFGTYAPGAGLITDDRGAFRAFNLPPGEYVVAAAVSEPSGSSGTYRPTMAEIDVGLFALQQRQAGRTPPARDAPPVSSTMVRHQPYGWAPVFYPGTTNVSEARRVRVGPGEVREDVSFAIGLAPLFAVAGSVLESDGTVAQAATVITRVGPPLPVSTTPSTALIRQNQSSGNFSFPGLAPGRYVVHSKSKEGRWASAVVLITDRDVREMTLVLEPPMSLAGRIAFATSSAAHPPDTTTVRVGLERRGPDGKPTPVEVSRTGPASTLPATELRPANPDGTFVITEIPPGRFALTAVTPSVSGPNWWLASATEAGRDLLDMPLNFGTDLHSLTDVVLTFSDRPAALTGRLQTAAGQPAADYLVIVFSADRAHWFPGARRTRAVRPATDGVFSVSELPAGSYLVAAVTDAYPDEWQRAEFLNQLAPFAVPVTIRAGETVRQDLQIAGQ